MLDTLKDKLIDPPKEYRPIPFWSWNEKLDEEILKWQIREMNKAGIGGYFMHARGGLETPYLGDEWMNCIKACIEEGKKLGMNSWCYDEEGWPSGFAGGIVTGMGDKYHVRFIVCDKVKVADAHVDKDVLCICTIDDNSTMIHEANVDDLPSDQNIWIVTQKSNPYYIDVLNEEVVKAFIESTYDKYYRTFKEDFRKNMLGFFTDEPQYTRTQIPWSYILPQKFKQKFGYDIVKVLPALFVDCLGYEKIRYDFWSLVNELFTSSFGKQLYEWCEQHNCKLTGHVLAEDSLMGQMNSSAGCMPFYEYMHIPGMDWLGRRIGNPVTPKQVSSVANQLGKKFVITETFALCGWDVSLEELKWIAEWQYVNGVNLMCQHLESYSIRGLRKRDYPPSLFYQQSWWDEYKQFNDYFARLGVFLSSGRDKASVLLIHPVKSAWIAYNNTHNDKLKALDSDFVWATETLSGLHFDHHYGDETIIGKYGSVDKTFFKIGNCSYNAIIIPSAITLDKKTIELLTQFAENGGLVISTGYFPRLCEGKENKLLKQLGEKVVHIGKNSLCLYNALKDGHPNHISIKDHDGEIGDIHYRWVDYGDEEAVFLVNHSQEKSFDATVIIGGRRIIKRYDVETGNMEELAYTLHGSDTFITLKFLPMQSYTIILGEDAENNGTSEEKECIEIKTNEYWKIKEIDSNSLTLDYCCYSVDGGEWEGPVPVITLMDTLLQMRKSCDIAMLFNFNVDMDIETNNEMYLILEKAEEFKIFVNGTRITYKDLGWWKDISFKKVDIKPYVKNGRNEIILKRQFFQKPKVYDVLFGENVLESEKNKLTYDVELESIYIIGDFGVTSKSDYIDGELKAVFSKGPFIITEMPKMLKNGDFTKQGLCFFAGSLNLEQNLVLHEIYGKRFVLKFNKLYCPACKVFINGKPVKTLLWAPYNVDITDYVVEGENKVALQLYASNRNLLGPHHHPKGELHRVTPRSFTGNPNQGGSNIDILWNDQFCFVKFGIL